jgi:hypothetical protein
MNMPVSYKDFAKDPVKALLFITLSAIGYLYIDNKMNYQDQVDSCYNKTELLEAKVETMNSKMRKSDSALAVAVTKLEILVKLNKIEDL